MINDIELKTIEKRLDGIKEGVQRLRNILIITTIASSAIFFVLFNSSLSRVHTQAVMERDHPLIPQEGKTFAEQGKEVLLNDWYKSRNIQVNFLGVSVNVTDLPIVGSLTLTVITIWYFYGYRQSNRAIVGILDEAHEYKESAGGKSGEEIISLRKMIYTSIAQTSVFTKNDALHSPHEDDSGSGPLTGWKATVVSFRGRVRNGLSVLRPAGDAVAKIRRGLRGWLLGGTDKPTYYGVRDKDVRKDPATFTDKVVKFMFYLPFWTTISIVAREIYNLSSLSPINHRQESLLGLMFANKEYWSIALAFLFSAFALVFAMYLLILCDGCAEFSKASTDSLWEFNEITKVMEKAVADGAHAQAEQPQNGSGDRRMFILIS